MANEKKEINLVVRVTIQMKTDLEDIAKKERRSLSDFLRLEFEKIIESKKDEVKK